MSFIGKAGYAWSSLDISMETPLRGKSRIVLKLQGNSRLV